MADYHKYLKRNINKTDHGAINENIDEIVLLGFQLTNIRQLFK